MIWYKKLRRLLSKRITIMVIPTVEGEVKQIRLMQSLVVMAIFFLASLGLFLTTSSIVLLSNNRTLNAENVDYSQTLNLKDNTIHTLEAITDQQQLEISQLSYQVNVSADYFQSKLDEIGALEQELNTLLGMFSQRTDFDVSMPVNRSATFSRTATQEVNLLNDLSNWEAEDVLSAQIAEQISAYNDLASELENTLDFIDAKPDLMPVDGIITSKFGNRRDPISRRISFHKGIDISNSSGTSIKAAGSGVVTFSGWSGSYGRVVVISHGFGYKSVYAHNRSNLVEVGTHVNKGDVIAKLGSSGKSTGPHVHFEVHYNGVQVDPLTVLNNQN